MTRWRIVYFVSLALLAAATVWTADTFARLRFRDFSLETIMGVLSVLFVTAVFIERALEVFINAWRGEETEARKLAKRRAAASLAKAAGDPDNLQRMRREAHAEEDRLTVYRAETRRIAFRAGTLVGVVVSAIGVRSIGPLLEPNMVIQDSTQYALFTLMDVFLTGGLLGGGSDGIHKVSALITDFLERTRERVNEPE